MLISPVRHAAFTLLELLAVMSIIVLVIAFVTPAVSSLVTGSKLTQASQLVTDQINVARQTALTKNRAVEVRFVRFADPETPGEVADNPKSGHYRALHLLEVLESGEAVPFDKLQTLPQSVVINDDKLSSLIGLDEQKKISASTSDPELPGIGRNYEYVAFRFLEDGSTNLSPTDGEAAGNWFVTLHNANDRISGSTPPANFFTLQIDPVSGATKAFRPR